MPSSRLPSLFERDSFSLEDAFRNLMRPMRWEGAAQAPDIKMDVSETDAAYTVKAEIPGVRKEDIRVEIEGSRVTLSAEVKKDSDEKKEGRIVRSERSYGFASRTFTLGHDVERNKAEAKYADGVLTLKLPKAPSSSAESLVVK